jgi:hypothetical protein
VQQFIGLGNRHGDDMTLVVLRVISNPVASELYGRGGFIGFVNTYQISWRTRPYKNYDDTIPNQTEMISSL